MTTAAREIDVPKTAILIRDWIAKKVDEARAEGIVIGLSGGVDSAVAAALSVDALGASRVHGMVLPCESSDDDIRDALVVAKHLGIFREVVDLTKVYETMVMTFKTLDHKLARANIKSRLRMTALYARANQRNYLVCGTTNLTEQYLGYFTKFGDGGVDIEPIICLLKREVRAMAAYKMFPDSIVNRVPSAGLWAGQTDEGELGSTYDRLDDAVLTLDSGPFDTCIATQDDIELVDARFRASAHKRQPPPGCTPPVFLKE